jgi:tetratricopeptide (TPR) repeat protein
MHLPGYEILGELGRGGMGVVYKARQIGLNRLVALKMILAGGHASAGELDRFRTEAEAVARLQHPNVVAIHEVGEQNGLPYFSLEYCEGGSLAARLDGTPWEPANAAALGETLARAMQAAHARGIVHRDLKPANILLAGDGKPKIADFGLAKQLDSGPGRTASGAIMGTPSYMAPEQAGGAKDVGPAADVYALGAVLYELLTGRPPFKAPTDLDTMLQVVSDDPVPPTRLQPKTPLDLETICLKCLAKEPARRYPAAEAMAEDLHRFRVGEPIAARPVGRLERGRRWCRRNPALAGSLAAIALALVLGAAVSTAFGMRANRNAERANRNAERADREAAAAVAARNRTREALDAMVSGVTGDSLATQTTLSEEQKRFLQSVLTYYEEFAAEPGEDSEGRQRLAKAHMSLGTIRYRLGQHDEGGREFSQGVLLWKQLAAEYPAVLAYRQVLARSHNNLGILLAGQGKRPEAEAAYRAALAVREKLAADYPAVSAYRQDLAGSHNSLGALLAGQGKRPEAEAAYRAALAVQEKLAADHPAVPAYRQDLAGSHNNVGALLAGQGKRPEAEAAYRAALAVREKLAAEHLAVPAYRQDLAQSHHNLGALLAGQGKRPEAEAAYRTALAVREKLAADHPAVPAYRQDLAQSHNNLGALLAGQGKWPEAEAALRAALVLKEKLATDYPAVPAYRADLAKSHNNVGNLLAGQGKRPEAEAAYRAALAVQEKLAADYPAVPAYRQDLAGSHNNLGILLRELGKRPEAEAAYRTALAVREKLAADYPAVPAYREDLAGSHHNLGIMLAGQGKRPEAEAAYRTALAVREKLAADYPAVPAYRQDLAQSHHNLGILLAGQGKRPEAEAAYRAALAVREKLAAEYPTVPQYRHDLTRSRLRVAELLARAGEHERAAAEAEPPTQSAKMTADTLYDAARVFALSSAAAKADVGLADRYGTRAVGLLRMAFVNGYTNVAHMVKDADLAPLRARPEYINLIWDLADVPFPAPARPIPRITR